MERKDLLELLKAKQLSLSCMESLTGGLFSASFTSIPGASKVFCGGAVTYSNEVKEAFGVKKETIDTHGAISKQCADEMAIRACYFFQSDVAVSFTGNAGPDAEEEKPVGSVYISIKIQDALFSYHLSLSGQRDEIRKQCVDFAFRQLYTLLNK